MPTAWALETMKRAAAEKVVEKTRALLQRMDDEPNFYDFPSYRAAVWRAIEERDALEVQRG